jgi:tetratricopeptide (TPR) repeat protein
MSTFDKWSDWVGTQVTHYKPGAAIAAPVVLALAGVWLIFQASSQAAPVVLLALAATCVGIWLGFLFGIPRVNEGTGNGSSNAGPNLRVNTNVEQISDWLTKILVGLTLANLQALPQMFARLSAYLTHHGLGGVTSESTITSVSIFFLVDGFLFGYLATRLYLTGAFLAADPAKLLDKLKPALAGLSTDFPGGGTELSADAAPAAKEIAKLNPSQLQGPEQHALWAKAQLGLGNPKKAVQGYAAAVEEAPERADLRVDHAIALTEAGEPRDRVLAELQKAYDQSPQNAETRRRAVEGLMLNKLYIPGAFDDVISLGREYLESGTSSGRIWMYLAAAFGQKHHELVGAAPPEQLAEVRANALDAVKRALALDSRLRGTIANMLKDDGEDNDLADFADDAEFVRAIESRR